MQAPPEPGEGATEEDADAAEENAVEVRSFYAPLGELADKVVGASSDGLKPIASSDVIGQYGVVVVQAAAAAAAFYFIVSSLFSSDWWAEPLVKVEDSQITGLNL